MELQYGLQAPGVTHTHTHIPLHPSISPYGINAVFDHPLPSCSLPFSSYADASKLMHPCLWDEKKKDTKAPMKKPRIYPFVRLPLI